MLPVSAPSERTTTEPAAIFAAARSEIALVHCIVDVGAVSELRLMGQRLQDLSGVGRERQSHLRAVVEGHDRDLLGGARWPTNSCAAWIAPAMGFPSMLSLASITSTTPNWFRGGSGRPG